MQESRKNAVLTFPAFLASSYGAEESFSILDLYLVTELEVQSSPESQDGAHS